MQGFIKKVFIADSIEPLVSHAFSLAHPTTADAWPGAPAYTVQLYFDFSGYSDMAIGRSEEHTSELQSLMRISSAASCFKKKNKNDARPLLTLHRITSKKE